MKKNNENKIKVAIVQRVILHYRKNLFERISKLDGVDLRLFHGSDCSGTKFKNCSGDMPFDHKEHITLKYINTKRPTARIIVFSPSLFFSLMKWNPDVIIIEGESNMTNNLFIYLYSRLFRKKLIWWGLGQIPGTVESRFQKMYKPLMKSILKKCSAVIGYSNYSRLYYSRFIEQGKVLVSHNCLDNEAIDNEIKEYGDRSLEVKNKYSPNGERILLFVGNIEEDKKVLNLVLAHQELRKRGHRLTTLIIGTGTQRDYLEGYCRERKIENIIFVGRVIKEISMYFLAADLFVLPGLGGLSIFHAMTHGLPVISARADGTEKEMIIEGENGYILKTYEPEELIAVLDGMLNEPGKIKDMGARSRRVVDEKINITHMVNVFEKAIRQ